MKSAAVTRGRVQVYWSSAGRLGRVSAYAVWQGDSQPPLPVRSLLSAPRLMPVFVIAFMVIVSE
jgi:hypothetical protein